MKDNNSFLVSLALLVLSVFLLFQAYNARIKLTRYQAEAEAKIESLKNPEEEFVDREFFNVFVYQVPDNWSILYTFGNEEHEYLKIILNEYLINEAIIGGKPETFQVEAYLNQEKYNDQWWQEQMDSYAQSIEYPSYDKKIDVYWGELRYISGRDEISEGGQRKS